MDGGVMVSKIKGDATSTFGSDIDVAGNVVTDAPAFRATLSADQSISSATITKIQLNSESFDTHSLYDNATNYRFTPDVAGYYQVNGSMRCEGTSVTQQILYLYKNGSFYGSLGHQRDSATISLLVFKLQQMVQQDMLG